MISSGEFGDMIFFLYSLQVTFYPSISSDFQMNEFETYESVLMGYEIQLTGIAILRMIN